MAWKKSPFNSVPSIACCSAHSRLCPRLVEHGSWSKVRVDAALQFVNYFELTDSAFWQAFFHSNRNDLVTISFLFYLTLALVLFFLDSLPRFLWPTFRVANFRTCIVRHRKVVKSEVFQTFRVNLIKHLTFIQN